VHRPAWAEISRSAIRHNVQALRRVLGSTALCGVVKANGYGHGAVVAATTLVDAGVESLAVAIVDEGVELRAGGVEVPILLLAEASPDALADALAARLTLTVGSLDGARAAVAAARAVGGRHLVHVKVDTGMHRMGVAPDQLTGVLGVLTECEGLEVEGLYTHFAVAESPRAEDRAYTAGQLARFDEALALARGAGVAPTRTHTANTAAAIALPEARRSMVRIGLGLYGYLPDPSLAAALADAGVALTPALSLHARVTAVRDLPAGERPSYGRRRALPARARVATVPFGYADGYPRRLFDAGATVLVGGTPRPLAGAVTMDQLVVDCGDADVAVGDAVVLLGTQGDATITADTWATWSGTISWEVLCGVGARVPRVVVD
jgi:alanine racemase